MQPVIGGLSDNCRSRYGKRRPYIVGTAAMTVLSLVAIGWAKELAQLIDGMSKGSLGRTDGRVNNLAGIFAMVGFFLLDFGINGCKFLLSALASTF
ncbi:Sucrose transport protein SUC5 [Smittium culicis]|uniref:Sucrose transport protein SUC5 n=1 Tax=Smittium culicis TaxID=133412 RepID=A0A1R1Y6B7_9FUNG|nr:Sucrose transport protein SUC5 [Smittium culicis]